MFYLLLQVGPQEEPVDTGLDSPAITHVDGIVEDDRTQYSFESSYHVDDVMDTLKELFDPKQVTVTLESRVQTALRSAQVLFVICLTVPPTSRRRKLHWPRMQEDHFKIILLAMPC